MLVSKEGITLLLNEWSGGDPAALERLVPLVYSDLRRMARVRLNKERRPNHTMQSTDLADEVLLRFLKQRSLHSWENRDSFYRVASSVMRNILVEYARHHWAKKRGAEHRVDFSFAKSEPSPERNAMLVLLVDDALRRLAAHDEDLADLVELKYFGGFENEEIAEVLGVSPATVKRKWKTAKAWLSSELKPTHGS